MYQTLKEESRLKFEKTVLFTDSMIVYSWVSYKPFVSARISEIQHKTEPSQWRHIPGSDNVADDVSRGVAVEELQGRWTKGPEFLRQAETEWPEESTPHEASENEPSERCKVCAVTAKEEEKGIDINKFSSWRRFVRVTARILRLSEKIRLRKHGQGRKRRSTNTRRAHRGGANLDQESTRVPAWSSRERRIRIPEPVRGRQGHHTTGFILKIRNEI